MEACVCVECNHLPFKLLSFYFHLHNIHNGTNFHFNYSFRTCWLAPAALWFMSFLSLFLEMHTQNLILNSSLLHIAIISIYEPCAWVGLGASFFINYYRQTSKFKLLRLFSTFPVFTPDLDVNRNDEDDYKRLSSIYNGSLSL